MIQNYIGLENIALTAPQKATLMNALAALGPATSNSPARLNHRRVRLDNDAAIYEAAFGDNDLTIASLKQYLANVFGVSSSLITNTNASQSFSSGTTLIVKLTYLGTDRMRFALFGGASATREQSRVEVLGYLALNAVAWGDA